MTTIVNTPGQGNSDSGSGMGMIVGVVLLIAFLFAFFVYGLPMLRSSVGSGSTTPQINVPDDINVNVNQPK